jgi:WD40 repeat protein
VLSFAFAVLMSVAEPEPSLDGQGDPLPAGASARIGTTRFRHGSWLLSLAFSPDGKRLSSTAYWHEDAVWDSATGRTLAYRCDRSTAPWHAIVSPDGTLVAGHVEEVGLCVQETGTGKERWRLPGKKNGVHGFAFSHDNRWLASSDDEGNAMLWDLETGRKQRQWKSPVTDRYDQHHAFSPDNKTLVHATPNGHLAAWDISSGKELYRIKPKEETLQHSIRDMSISPDGELLATRAFLGSIRLWRLKTGKLEREIDGRLDGGPVFSLDGTKIAAAEEGGSIHLWDPATGKLLRTLESKPFERTRCLAFSPDGKRLAGGDDHVIHLWDLDADKEMFPNPEHPATEVAAKLLTDGNLLLRYHYEPLTNYGDVDGKLDFYDVAGKPQKRVKFDFKLGERSFYSPVAMAVAPDGGSLVFATGVSFLRHHRPLANGELHADLRFFDVASNKELQSWNRLPCEIDDLSFSPDGQYLTASVDKAGPKKDDYWRTSIVELWHRDSPTSLKKLVELPSGHRSKVRWSPDSRWFCVGTKTGWDFFDTMAGKCVHKCPDLDQSIGAVSPSGRRLVCWNFEKQTAEVAEQATGRTICKLDTGGIYVVWSSFAVSPDGRVVAGDLSEADVFLWDALTGKKIATLKGHRGSIKSLCFSADGRHLISGSADTTVLVWDYRESIREQGATLLSPKRLQKIWSDLQSSDAAVAYAAVSDLASSPDQALALLRQKLTPTTPADHARIETWIARLDEESFQERERAQKELDVVRDFAEPILLHALAGKLSLETKRRVESMLARLIDSPSPIWLAHLRAFEALERIGTPAARELVEQIAAGQPEAPLTLEARRTLDRMRR